MDYLKTISEEAKSTSFYNSMKYIVKGGLLAGTYANISNKVANKIEFLKEISINAHRYFKWYGDDLIGSFALAAIYNEVLRKIDKLRINRYADILSIIMSTTSLTLLEMFQKYNIMSGCYDENDIKAFSLGSFIYLVYKKIKK